MNAVVVLPTYNEADNIPSLIPKVVEAVPQARIIVVDDESPDGTAALVRELQERFPQVELRTRTRRSGLGSAYIETFASLAHQSDVDAVCTMDSDFSHDPGDLPRLLAGLDASDVIVGSRYIDGGRIVGWQLGRHVISRLGNIYARHIARVGVHDLTSGFVCFRRTVLRQIPLEKIHSSGYAYTIESKCLAAHLGARVTEIPITFTERREGRSKFSADIVREGILAPWRVRAVP